MWRYSLTSSSSKRALKLISSPNPTSSLLSPLNSIPNSPFSIKLGLGFGSPLLSRSGFASSTVDATSSSSSSVVSRDVVGAVSHYGKCYWELSKAKLSMLVVATSGTGYVLGSSQVIDFAGLCWTCAGTMMVAASASSLNQVFEVKSDAKMKRTMRRPLPSGRLTIPHALTWASSVGLAGTYLLTYKANALAAGLAASNLVLYAFVYTPLKQIHPVNTWVGAIVGAIPPLLGWAAASGEISLNGMILPAALYFWQLPHFMALAYMCRDDYATGGYKMLTLFDPTGRRTALVALRNCLYLIPLGYLAYQWGLTSGWFCFESSLLTLAIGSTALSFYFDRTTKNARRMFFASLLYLPVFMSGLMLHRLSDDWRSCLRNESDSTTNTTVSLSSRFEQDNGELEDHRMEEKNSDTGVRGQARGWGRGRPPVAYASVAPFPFLPAPCYAES